MEPLYPEYEDIMSAKQNYVSPTVSDEGGVCHVLLPKTLTENLRELSRQEGITLYMTLVAAFQTLLYRYSGQDDIVIGTASAGRSHLETEELVGLFTNTLVVHSDLSGDPTFRELLGRVHKVVLEAQTHQDLPFELLVKELQLQRQVGQNTLFQLMVTFEPPLLASLSPGWTVSAREGVTTTSRFTLTFNLVDGPEGLLSCFKHYTDLFDEATIARMAGHWQTLLEGIVTDPERRLSELPILTRQERHQLLVEWNATDADYPKDQCIHQLFEAQVERTPEAVAVIYEGQTLTYRELNVRANQLAHYLQRLGVGPEVLVGICVERSLEMMIGILGILKAGGAYVPIDPTYPSQRIAFMLEDSQVSVLLTHQHLNKKIPKHEARDVYLDTMSEAIARESEENAITGIASVNLAYMIYTSGSTGKPKGVLAIHRAAINRFNWMWEAYPFKPDEICCQKTSLSFVDSVWEMFGPLLQGIRTVIIPDIVVKDPELLLQTLAANSVTRIVLVPSLLRMLLDTKVDLHKRLPDLKYWISSGEMLPLELALRFLNSMPQSVLLNLYGSSEVAADVTCFDTRDGKSLTSIPIGRPIANVQIYLLDQHLQLVPIGVTGELYVGGDGLARGYFNRPKLTSERFIPNPFTNEPGAYLYKTGDLAYYHPDGTIELIGRLDQQVKVRGYRIELGEIEAVLSGHPAVRQAVAVVREDVPGDKRLVAYVVLHSDQSATTDNLKSHAMKRLPNYMVPSAFMVLEALPLTPNGKIDRRALPELDSCRGTTAETYVAPTHTLHRQLIAIWEELLNVRPIGIRNNFFYLGGNSLLAVQLVDRIEQIFHQNLQLATLFAGPTIEQLAAALQAQVESDSQLPVKVIQIQAGKAKRPLFFLHGNWRGDGFYCYPLARALGTEQPFYALTPYPLDGLRTPPTLEEVAAAHIEALRTEQPNGPYMLGGWCNGALVAYEMARQLYTQGQKVDLLFLVNPAELVPHAHLKWVSNAIRHFGYLLHLSSEKQLNWFLRLYHINNYLHYATFRRTVEFKQLEAACHDKWAGQGKRSGRLLSLLEMLFPAIELLRMYEPIFMWIASSYTPSSPYSGKITFLWHQDEPYDEAAWQQVIESTEAEVYILPGTHKTLLTEHLSELAEQLRSCIASVQSEEHQTIKRFH